MIEFDSHFLQKLEYLSLLSKRAHHGQMLAQRTTSQRGSGIEFADHQEYALGDDFRYLDWNVFARHGELLLKRFHEERDSRVDILIDASRSMSVGETQSKFDYARRVAAALAYIALAQMDRVAVTVFADQILATRPEARGKAQILPLLRFLQQLETQGTDTNLDFVTQRMTQIGGVGGLAIIVSDFYDRRGFQRALDRLRYHQFEVYLVHVFDPREADPKLRGDVELVDVETGELRVVTVRPRDVQRYQQAFQAFCDELQAYARHHGLGYIGTSTDVSYEELILMMMRRAGWLGRP